MTGYARHEIKASWGNAIWEIRSVNQRYLETNQRLPEIFRSLEPILRDKLRKKLARGKVECSLRYEAATNQDNTTLTINLPLATQIIEASNQISNLTEQKTLEVNPLTILKWPGVLESPEPDLDLINKELLTGFDIVLNDFIQARANEGENIKGMIEQRLNTIKVEAQSVREHMPDIIKWQRERVELKCKDLQSDIDSSRLEQELILLSQKIDVAEEIDRLDSHVKETLAILKKGGACGRRLDFMMQEFNRESNTLASKSISTEITNSAVELKVLIEQMREQIQNIE